MPQVLEAKLITSKTSWHSMIKSLKPYQHLDGPFKKWRHLHRFSDIDNHYQKQTEIIDEVDFEIPYSHIGKLFEGYACTRLQKLFDYRKAATVRTLKGNM
ncbi:MAG: hypothetical protein WBF33_32345 [Candidatus Nitrosopolaris sp.]|jgi:ligand-binding SRPBCC domain-containing protein